MSKIIFTEKRQLLDLTFVGPGEERDFGDAENAAFVQNGVAKWEAPEAAAAPAAPAQPDAASAAAAQVSTVEANLETAIENKIHLQEVKSNE